MCESDASHAFPELSPPNLRITAEGEVGKLGLSGNCADVYVSFAQGQVPDAKKLQALEHEFGGDEVGRGAVRRLRAAALSGDLSIVAPLVSWQELGRK